MRTRRLQEIVDYVNQERTASFSTLCTHFNTSPATMRRDLKVLGDEGLIERVHGGARTLQHRMTREDYLYPQRLVRNVEEKKRIARRALEELHDGDVLILDSSTTVFELARLIASSNLKLAVLTNDLMVASLLQDVPTIDLLSIGGSIRTSSSHATGVFAENMLMQLHADKLFLGVDAIDAAEGGLVCHVDEIKCKQLMVQQSRQRIVLCDHTKFLESGMALVCPVGSIDKIISGVNLDEGIASEFKGHENLELILV